MTVSPCSKCGATRAESLHDGFFHWAFKKFGYRLTKCARCRSWRVFHKGKKKKKRNEDLISPQVEPHTGAGEESTPAIAETMEAATTAADTSVPAEDIAKEKHKHRGACPSCGSKDYRASRRTIRERLLGQPQMMRCRKCRRRFPYTSIEVEVE